MTEDRDTNLRRFIGDLPRVIIPAPQPAESEGSAEPAESDEG